MKNRESLVLFLLTHNMLDTCSRVIALSPLRTLILIHRIANAVVNIVIIVMIIIHCDDLMQNFRVILQESNSHKKGT
jgi:hypothetical protein